ncbi:MAG: hypothetical protein A2V67_05720 [Deltaproteobacteria bacterium RBG_13_61_14]|nr:MAG: hypothetical protein A2V67_05720 [Deltaproteobacteria bacterium RBG_13_61_14]
MITVKLFADLREAAGVKDLELQAQTVAEALAQLRARFGEKLEAHLPRAAVLVNGENVRFLKGEKTRLKPGDTLSLLPPVAGG